MYKFVLALIISGLSCQAFAADEAVGGLPLGGLPKAEEPKTKDINGVPLIEDNSKPKLKSVKDLFKPSKKSEPKAPEIISDKPEENEDESPDAQPQQPVAAETPAAVAAPTPSPTSEPEKTQTPATVQAPVAEISSTDNPTNPIEQADSEEVPEEKNDKVDISAEGTSIMFDQTNIYRVMRVLSAYIESQSNNVDTAVQEQSKKSLEELQQELLAKLRPEDFVKGKNDIVTVRLPGYVRVDTLIFRSPTNKKVWVNSRQFAEGENNGELTVKAIQPEWAYIELSTKDTNIGLDKFDKLLKKSENPNSVKIDLVKQTIGFRLSVNQYIDIASLKIKEGDFTGSFGSKFYDPTKPEDRFVPLEEAEKALEAEALEAAKEQSINPNLDEENPVEAIDSEETPDGEKDAQAPITITPDAPVTEATKPTESKPAEVKPTEAEKTIIETSPEKL